MKTNYEGVPCTPSQLKTIQSLHEKILEHHGDGYEFKRFEVYPFSSSKAVEVFTEVGKVEETALEALTSRTVRQLFIGERGKCELAGRKVTGLMECIQAELS